jgi:hypothetical protein
VDNERRRRGEEEGDQETDIKSNNPHLAGGELLKKVRKINQKNKLKKITG